MVALAEYRARQKGFADRLAAEGLNGALVISRGGSTFDRYGQVQYLTGHYQSYSYLPDAPGLFSGRSHTAFAITAAGANALCVSVPEYDAAALAVDDIRISDDFAATVAATLADLGLAAGPIGLVGADVLPMRYWLQLRDRTPDAGFVDVDDLLLQLRRVKSEAEQAIVRRAAAIHRRGFSELMEAIRPGATEADLVAALAESVLREGAGLYFTSVSSGPASGRWASQPSPGFSRRVLAPGDLVRCDTGIVFEGYLSDFGRSAVVGGPDTDQQRLLDTLHGGLEAAIAAVRPGVTVSSVAAAGDAALANAGVVSTAEGGDGIVASFPVHWGHGLGLGWEPPWITATEPTTIVPGMYLAIERALTLPGVGTAAAEQTLLIGKSGVEVLTAGKNGFWS